MKMKKKDFIEQFEENLRKYEAISATDEVIIWLEDTEATDEASEEFIVNTNIKYFDDDSKKLLGNFAQVNINAEGNEFLRFDLDFLYGRMCDAGMSAVLMHVKDNREYANTINGNANDVISKMQDYEAIQNRLIFRPLNYKEKELEGYHFRKFGDIALTLYAVVFDDDVNSSLNTIKIPQCVVDEWPVSDDELFISVMNNTMLFAPCRAYTNLLQMDSTPIERSAILSDVFEDKHWSDTIIPLVTTTRKTNGAISLFYPGVKEKIAELFDGSFYVAFTSIHEAMIHKAGTIAPEAIKRHVQATNRTFGPAETLSDEVFYYNRESGIFTAVVTE